MLVLAVRFTLFLVGSTLLLDQLDAYSLGAFRVSPNKALTFLLLLLAGIQWLLSGGRKPRNSKTPWILAFYVSLALSTIYAATQGSDWAFLLVRWTTFLAMLCFYFLMCFTIRARKDLDIFLVALIVSGLVAALSAYFSEGVGGYRGPVRKSGVGSGQNQAAGNLLAILPLAYALAMTIQSRIGKLFLFGSAFTLVLGFVLAVSRSAFLAVVAMGGVFLIRSRRLPDPRLILATVVLAAFAIAMAPEGYVERLTTLLPSGASRQQNTYRHYSFSGRADVYEASLVGLATHPVLGVGTERYLDWVGSYNPKLAGGYTVHNAILAVACQQGLLGLIPYLAILILTFRDFTHAQRLALARRDLRDPELEALYLRSLMAQIGYTGVLVVAQFQPGTFWRMLWVMFALSTVLLAFTRQRVAELDSQASENRVDEPNTSLQGVYPQHGHPFRDAATET